MCRGACLTISRTRVLTALRFLELWKTDRFSDVSLAQCLAFTPYELVRAHLNIDRSVLANVGCRRHPWCRPERS